MKFGDAAKSDATDSRDQRKRKAIKEFSNAPDTCNAAMCSCK